MVAILNLSELSSWSQSICDGNSQETKGKSLLRPSSLQKFVGRCTEHPSGQMGSSEKAKNLKIQEAGLLRLTVRMPVAIMKIAATAVTP